MDFKELMMLFRRKRRMLENEAFTLTVCARFPLNFDFISWPELQWFESTYVQADDEKVYLNNL